METKNYKSRTSWRRQPHSLGLRITLLQWAFGVVSIALSAASALAWSPGVVSPSKLEMAIGDSKNITCQSTDRSSLWFYEQNSNRSIPSNDIAIIDDKTVVLMFRNASEQKSIYRCHNSNGAIGEAEVYVGTPPLNVTDFKCRVFDYDNMTCKYHRPHNAIYTFYEVKHTIDGFSYEYKYNVTNEENDWMSFTIWSDDRVHKYSPYSDTYKFHVIGKNALGSNEQVFIVKNHQIVIPAKLDIDNTTTTTTDSITFKWRNLNFAKYLNLQEFVYNFTVRPKGSNKITVFANFESCKTNYCNLTLEGLPYPNWVYNVRARVRVKNALNLEEMWSEAFVGEFKTKPCRPYKPPQVAIGSFYINPSESQVRLYWNGLMPFEQNGPIFNYTVNEIQAYNAPAHVTNNTDIVFDWYRDNRIYSIKSQNLYGHCIDESVVQVYASTKDSEHYSPQAIESLYDNIKRRYTLLWKPPRYKDYLSNYTIFWCKKKIASNTQCDGTINFVYIDAASKNFTSNATDDSIILAVSANYPKFSSGMHWTSCSASIWSDLEKMKPEAVAKSSSEIDIRWSFENFCTSLLIGYNVTFCQVMNTTLAGDDEECISNPRTFTLLRSDMDYKSYTISDLNPYSIYRITMLMYSQSKISPRSDPLYVTTKEAAPTPPRNFSVNYSTVTSDSAELSWMSPSALNGNLKSYTVFLSYEKASPTNITLPLESLNITNEEITYKLQNLSSYTQFTIYVTAETVESSQPSEKRKFTTLVGRPSNPRDVHVIPGSSYNILEWTSPVSPSGRVEVYEILMEIEYKGYPQTEKRKSYFISDRSSTSHSCKFRPVECTGRTMQYNISVRAINLAERHEIDNKTFRLLPGKYRRHTSPKISTNAVKHQGFDESVLREIETLYTQDEMRGVYVEVFELPDSEFDCTPLGEEGKLENRAKMFQLESDWQAAYGSNTCTKFSWDDVFTLAVMILFGMAVFSLISYMGHKKFSEMKNIEAILPPGLMEHMATNSKVCNGMVSNSFEGKIEKDQPDVAMNFTFLNCSKEDCHLLNSSNAFNSLTPSGSESGSKDGNSDSNDLLDQFQNEDRSSESTETLEMRDTCSLSCHDSPLKVKRVDVSPFEFKTPIQESSTSDNYCRNGFVTPSSLLLAKNPIVDNVQKTFPATQSGFLNPIMMPPLQTGGYVTADTLAKMAVTAPPATAVSLPQVTDLGSNPAQYKHQNELNGEGNLSTTLCSSNPSQGNSNHNDNNNTICGYVTPKQLAEFGQLIH